MNDNYIMSGICNRPAFIPGPNGYYKLDPCIVESIEYNTHMEHFSCRGGLTSQSVAAHVEQTITIRAGGMEEIGDPFDHSPIIEKSLDDYSNLDLLKELEKRTKTDSY